jgi:glycerate dehydrogenase
MEIVVLDGYALNPGDLSWAPLEELGACRVYDRTPPERVIERAGGAAAVLTNKTVLDRPVLEALPALKYIGVLATGYNVVDAAAATERGIAVTRVPDYATASVAQMVFALLLELCHHVGDHARGVRNGRWAASRDFCYWDAAQIELAGLTMGLIGFGRIGQAVSHLAMAFGMKPIACDVAHPPHHWIQYVDLRTLLRRSDVVSLHCPLTPATEGLINAERLAQMKRSAFLISTSRGAVVNERDLADALGAGRIAGAAVDVLAAEPPAPDNPLVSAPNCVITPHIAWATRAARQRLLAAAVENLAAWKKGKPRNVVVA